uniref:Conserved secreted protein n=1 Tax=Haemonchus contortus TaxID=6289 RepID=A0A7I5ED02_HAECO
VSRMLLVFLVLVLIPQNFATQASESTLSQEWKNAFEVLNLMYGDNLKWSDEWANKALEYLKSPNSVKADMAIEGEQSFPEHDRQSVLQKLLAFLGPRFGEIDKALEGLPMGTIYGCNGVVNKKGNRDFISAACVYKKP